MPAKLNRAEISPLEIVDQSDIDMIKFRTGHTVNDKAVVESYTLLGSGQFTPQAISEFGSPQVNLNVGEKGLSSADSALSSSLKANYALPVYANHDTTVERSPLAWIFGGKKMGDRLITVVAWKKGVYQEGFNSISLEGSLKTSGNDVIFDSINAAAFVDTRMAKPGSPSAERLVSIAAEKKMRIAASELSVAEIADRLTIEDVKKITRIKEINPEQLYSPKEAFKNESFKKYMDAELAKQIEEIKSGFSDYEKIKQENYKLKTLPELLKKGKDVDSSAGFSKYLNKQFETYGNIENLDEFIKNQKSEWDSFHESATPKEENNVPQGEKLEKPGEIDVSGF